MRSPNWAFAVLLILVGSLTAPLWGEEEDMSGAKASDFIKSRAYIGVFGISSTIDQWGDFSGVNSFTTSSAVTTGNPEVDLIPSITRQFGWGALFGYREGPWAGELSFMRSDHTASYISSGPATTTTPASLQSIDFNLKRYFFTQYPLQPFLNLGIAFPWLWVHHFSYLTDTASPPNIVSTDDETISGIGMNLGLGVEFYFENDFSLVGGLFQRWGEFDQINGAAKIPFNELYFDGDPNDVGALAGNGLTFYFGATVGVE
ncbi:MAG TPA: hypothetical protein VHE12_01275 [bacterium]|nr:hypothetical protein [bacterium]